MVPLNYGQSWDLNTDHPAPGCILSSAGHRGLTELDSEQASGRQVLHVDVHDQVCGSALGFKHVHLSLSHPHFCFKSSFFCLYF